VVRLDSILILSLRLPYAPARTLKYVSDTKQLGSVRVDPSRLEPGSPTGQIELIVLYTEPAITQAVLGRVVSLSAGLDAKISLVAVHSVPYQVPLECPAAVHSYLERQLTNLADSCSLPVSPLIVLARSRAEGFGFALKRGSTIVIGTRRQFWRTRERSLARDLAGSGHKVVLVYV
jgi:hypothetical protein